MLAMAIKPTIGVGDALQFSSLPENWFKQTGEKVIDVDKHWFFDHNPYVDRDPEKVPTKTIQMWNFSPLQYQWPNPRGSDKPAVYLSNAEIWAAVAGVPCKLNRPRLYRFEDYPFENREMILLHLKGISHGEMPKHIVEHVIKKYGPTKQLHIIGPTFPELGLPHIQTETLWDLAEVISKARMLIGMDSGPSWIAACYPDVIVKKVRTKPLPEIFKTWVPLEIRNIHSHWDDRCHQIFNPTDEDIGFTSSYLKI